MSRQHYVPQALLKNFAFDGKKKKVFVFNKQTGKIGRKSIMSICSVINYLSTKIENFDKLFTLIDNESPIIVNKILNGSSLNKVCKSDKKVLSQFAAYQYVRGLAARQIAEEVFGEHFNYANVKKCLEFFNFDTPLLRYPEEYIKEI